ncbi:MAG TPA: HD-GYP domain-containing protein [Gaiellaceae bacterium]
MARRTTPELVTRSLTLLRAFVLLSAVILAVGAVVLGTVLTGALRTQAIEDAEASLTQYTGAVIGPRLVQDGDVVVGADATDIVQADLDQRPEILSVKVWRPDGVLAWTSLDQDRIGQRFPLGKDLEEALETGEAEGELEDLHDAEDASEADLGVDHVLEVYAPLTSGSEVVGAYEVYADSATLESSIAAHRRLIWLTTGAVFFVLWAALVVLARNASRTLTRQTETVRERSLALAESYRRQEEAALEAVETLNATVEAKDPYTAGHSVRVQQIAVAVGEELGLSPKELDAPRFGGLFHDIGKLAVPDAILTKPDRLTADEYERIKEHSAEGARIVAKFGRLRDSVAMIRHHHERWDGLGYPDGLAGPEIPLTAAIVGLADAWDAMTTERPYHRALDVEEAFAEIREGRGTQFVPEVTDAFFSVVRKRPGDFGLLGPADDVRAAG